MATEKNKKATGKHIKTVVIVKTKIPIESIKSSKKLEKVNKILPKVKWLAS